MSSPLVDAVQHLRTGRVQAAQAALRAQLATNPHDASALMLLSAAALAGRDPRRARDLAQRAARLAPADPRAQAALATALAACGEAVPAITAWRRVLARDPGAAVAHANLGQLLLAKAAPADALAACDRALALDPALPAALLHRGLAALALGDLAAGEADLRAAQARLPDNAAAWIGLGDALRQGGRHIEAVDALERAVAIDPRDAGAWLLLGQALRALGRHDAAVGAFDRALALDPGRHAARWQRAVARLLAGQLSAAWEDFEARWNMPGMAPRAMLTAPRWRGEALRGRTILVTAEQGLGDAIQFARYAPLLAARGAQVVLETPPALLRLFGSLAGVQALLPTGAVPPRFDCHCPLLSLPLGFATGLETVPARVPYLSAEPDRLARWQARIGRQGGPAVGVVWAGNPLHGNDRNRSLPAAALAALTALPGLRLFSLQCGPRAGEAAGLVDLAPALTDFAETAAAIMALDLVVTVDTAVAHLAGALGQPVWVLLAHEPDWRWMTGRADSPWYPTARLFRQATPGDWRGVLRQVAAALPALARA
jgi:tetratricopeptide (TPR) repeat protein